MKILQNWKWTLISLVISLIVALIFAHTMAFFLTQVLHIGINFWAFFVLGYSFFWASLLYQEKNEHRR